MREHSQPHRPNWLRRIAVCPLRSSARSATGSANIEQEHRAIVPHRETRDRPADLRIHDVREFISRPIAFHLKGRHFVSEIAFELPLGTPDEFAHTRMQSVRPDHQIEVARRTAVERHVHAPVGLFETRDRVAEPRLDAT